MLKMLFASAAIMAGQAALANAYYECSARQGFYLYEWALPQETALEDIETLRVRVTEFTSPVVYDIELNRSEFGAGRFEGEDALRGTIVVIFEPVAGMSSLPFSIRSRKLQVEGSCSIRYYRN